MSASVIKAVMDCGRVSISVNFVRNVLKRTWLSWSSNV